MAGIGSSRVAKRTQVFGPYNSSMIDHNILRMQLARMPKGSKIDQ